MQQMLVQSCGRLLKKELELFDEKEEWGSNTPKIIDNDVAERRKED